MGRRWHHFTEWECIAAGMYVPIDPTEARVSEACSVLGDARSCRTAMLDVLDRWPVSTAQALSDSSRNRRAWLGRACVCVTTGHPESVTRVAWFRLTPEQQAEANAIADAVIAEWEDTYAEEESCQRSLWA